MNILSIGWFGARSSTSLHRHWALEKCASKIDMVNIKKGEFSLFFRICYHLFQLGLPIKLPNEFKVNEEIKNLVSKNHYNLIWIDKGTTINKETLIYIKKKLPNVTIVSYSPDNMALRHNQSQNYLNCLPYYDHVFTNKSYILNNLRELGAQKVTFVNNSYEDSFHYPRKLTKKDLESFSGDVVFIGAWEQERYDSILYLARNGVKVTIFGDDKWKKFSHCSSNMIIKRGLYDDSYPKALQAFKISLCFLRKMNSDLQTTRTMEIPACEGFLMAERTKEHIDLFKDKEEAVFFESNEELLELCEYYLKHEKEREKIRKAGYQRCITSGYSNKKTIKRMVEIALEIKEPKSLKKTLPH